jgi:D-glycero-D-manno-heptose 1,7-bisphosphate phosphatase
MKGVAVFVDRDGVIIKNRDTYVKSLAEVEELPGAIASLARLSRAGHPVIIVSNQSGIGRGLVSWQVVREINARIRRSVEICGGLIDAIMVCPHLPDARCECRKPGIGLLVEAGQRLGLDLRTAYMIGDQLADVEAGTKAGCRPILLHSPFASKHDADAAGIPYCADLTAATDLILNADTRAVA